MALHLRRAALAVRSTALPLARAQAVRPLSAPHPGNTGLSVSLTLVPHVMAACLPSWRADRDRDERQVCLRREGKPDLRVR
jgi:hypothetical protein